MIDFIKFPPTESRAIKQFSQKWGAAPKYRLKVTNIACEFPIFHHIFIRLPWLS